MEILLRICSILILAGGFLYAYQTLYLVLGLFFTKKFKKASVYHKYAVLVCARNEEKVIGQLIDSINKQDYPKDKITVFVVADNCTDKTAQIAQKHGAVCYSRTDTEHCTKGYALRFLFEKIDEDYGRDSFEAYMIFDADNLLKRDFVRRMNDAFDSGEKIITSYRNTKNFDSNFIAAGYGIHWLRTVRFASRARAFLGLSTWVQGCGFMFSAELVRDGWNFTSLTEDRAFSIDAVSRGYRITYQHEAEFYDEQPTDMKMVMRQRIRWAKGHIQAFMQYWSVLVRGIFTHKGLRRKWCCYDMLVTMMPYCLIFIPLKLLWYIANTVIMICTAMSVFGYLGILPGLLKILIFEHFGVIPMALLVFILEHGRIARIKWYKVVFYSLMFPLFGIIGDIATWIALFKKVTWKPILHDKSVRIDDMEDKIPTLQKK